MPKDQIENTESLQERFPQVYKKFFAQHDLVVSSDMSFSVLPGVSWRSGAPSVLLKLPFRLYVGIKPNNKKGSITLEAEKAYYVHKQEFCNIDYEGLSWSAVLPLLEKLMAKKLNQTDFPGVDISSLLEKPENTGLDAGLSVTLIMALYQYYGLISADDVKQITQLTGEEIQKKETRPAQLFSELFTDAAKVYALSFAGVIAGAVSFSSMLNADCPLVTLTEERAGSIENPIMDLPPLDVSGDINTLDGFKYWGFRLSELTDVTGTLPLDVVGIYPGTARQYGWASDYMKNVVMPEFEELKDEMGDIFSKLDIEDPNRAPFFMKVLEQPGSYWVSTIRGMLFSRLVLFNELLKVYKYRLKSTAVVSFLETLDSVFTINGPIEEPVSPNIAYIVRKIRNKAHERGVPVGIRSTCWGKQDGSLMVFSPMHKFSDELFEVMKEIRQEHNPKVFVEFVSWRDGWGSEGGKVEQHISKDIFSKFIDQDARRLSVYDRESGSEILITQDDPDSTQFDIILDKTTSKLMIGGSEVTSKDIPSQKATIEILEFLLQNADHTITNSQLPNSNYVKYRNEFQGKIVTPLTKTVRERTGKSLEIHCKGKLMTFDIEFNLNGLKIAILEKIA